MDTITINNIKEAIGRLIERHHERIWTSYLRSEKGIKVAIPLTLQPHAESGGVKIIVGLRLVTDRIDDGIALHVDEKQLAMFKAVDNLRPKPGDGIESVTISAGGESVELRARGEDGKGANP